MKSRSLSVALMSCLLPLGCDSGSGPSAPLPGSVSNSADAAAPADAAKTKSKAKGAVGLQPVGAAD